jgi:hypothetical protein
MTIDANSSLYDVVQFMKQTTLFQGQELNISTVDDFLNAMDGVPSERENEIPDALIEFYNSQVSSQIPPEEDPEVPKPKPEKKEKPKWDGVGEPFRAGTKFAEVLEMIQNSEINREDLQKHLSEKYGEKTGSKANVGVYISTIAHKLSDFYTFEENPILRLTKK